jgi:hypothetical protein
VDTFRTQKAHKTYEELANEESDERPPPEEKPLAKVRLNYYTQQKVKYLDE